jgi:3-hydroxyisobutyrate dehydrogenase-like beta-hydroxyacid dehydrogenase
MARYLTERGHAVVGYDKLASTIDGVAVAHDAQVAVNLADAVIVAHNDPDFRDLFFGDRFVVDCWRSEPTNASNVRAIGVESPQMGGTSSDVDNHAVKTESR